jgi:hypothetical protein
MTNQDQPGEQVSAEGLLASELRRCSIMEYKGGDSYRPAYNPVQLKTGDHVRHGAAQSDDPDAFVTEIRFPVEAVQA